MSFTLCRGTLRQQLLHDSQSIMVVTQEYTCLSSQSSPVSVQQLCDTIDLQTEPVDVPIHYKDQWATLMLLVEVLVS